MSSDTPSRMAVCVALTRALGRTCAVEEILSLGLDALEQGLAVTRSAILLFDDDGVMRFKAWRRLSDGYRAAVEGHTPWRPDTRDPEPIIVADVAREPSLAALLPALRDEGIAAMALVPMLGRGRVIGKCVLYYGEPHEPGATEVLSAGLMASQLAFAVERARAEASARQSEERLRYALDAAVMGTWEFDLRAQSVRWSENLEAIHGLAPGTFDGTFASYQREIHPEDAPRVLASLERAIADGTPHEIEYRIIAPDGRVRWVEGKGRVEYEDGAPARMSGVCMDVTRRKEAELARLAAAEEASRLKDEFLATLSHELRTPLNAILGWAQMLEDGCVPPDRVRQALEVIGRNARLQARLIEDILDISRILAGKLEIQCEPVTVARLVEAVTAAMLPAATGKKIQLVRIVPENLPAIDGDPKRLHQMLGNVLSNALKFTPDGGRIEIRCSIDGEAIVIEVCDNGIGIDPGFLPYVFDRFSQADSRSTRSHGGLGLGLAIARHLAERHGGEIQAESAGAGCGTTIRMRLPLGREAVPARGARGSALSSQDFRTGASRDAASSASGPHG